MYFLEAPEAAVEGFKQAWDAIGDSIVVVGDDDVWNCHIHTDDIGAAIEAALDAGGRPCQIRVTDLSEQVAEERKNRERVTTAVVAVGAGEGIDGILRSLGVQEVVAGGQSMNPSTAQILDAVEATTADEVVVLPNNKNVVPVAEQAAKVAGRPVRVVPTKSIAEGLASLLAYDPSASAATNAEGMAAASREVAWGEVTRAVRDADVDGLHVEAGQVLGIHDGRVVAVASSPEEALLRTFEQAPTEALEIVTVYYGESASERQAQAVADRIRQAHPGLAVEIVEGGQPHYPYVVSLE
jgi:dihydroxyacetone kinase-like predicted kinase